MILTVETLSNILGKEITDSCEILNEYSKMEVEDVKVIKDKVVFTVVKSNKSFENSCYGGQTLAIEFDGNDIYDINEYKKCYTFEEAIAIESKAKEEGCSLEEPLESSKKTKNQQEKKPGIINQAAKKFVGLYSGKIENNKANSDMIYEWWA